VVKLACSIVGCVLLVGVVQAEPGVVPAPPPGTDRMKDPATPLAALTDDPLLGHSPRINGDEVKGVVAFTFDDGPNPETTPAVIEALVKYDVPATFFIVTQRLLGKHGDKSRDLLAHELSAGFLVGSHSVTHQLLKHAAGATVTKEIDASFRTLAREADRPIGMFRPPYGALSGSGRARADKLRKKVLRMILHDGGGVVLMHDVKPITARIIADVLDDLEAENCARLAAKTEPIWPVSIHYFLRDGSKTARAIPEDVIKRTAGYKAALPARCANRVKPPVKEDSQPCLGNPLAASCR
jgi:peptidoglycan/xylan/chitin deacetylase (PgdA/CDA1 family)